MVIPLIINIAIFSIALWMGIQWFEYFLNSFLPTWLGWLQFLLWPLFALAYFLLVFYLFALIINVIAAPFNGLLAEKVEQTLRGMTITESNTTIMALLKEVPRNIMNELGKLFYFLIRSIPLLVLFVIPGINFMAPILWFLFSAWMLSLEYLDYPLSNHGVLFENTRRRVRKRRITCLGFGAAVSATTMIPFINFIAMPAAVAGATALYVEQLSDSKLRPITSK